MKRRIYIKKISSLNPILLLLFSTIAGFSSFYSQKIHHTDPYFSEISWHFDFILKEVILKNKIKKVIISGLDIKENGKEKKLSKNNMIIEYNAEGNPTRISFTVKNTFDPAKGKFNKTEPLAKNNRQHLTTFYYDSLNRLIRFVQNIPEYGKRGRTLIEISNCYNDYGNLILQTEQEIRYHNNSFFNPKLHYENDTSLITTTIEYISKDTVKTIIFKYNDPTIIETYDYHTPIDSILHWLTLPNETEIIIKDSLGRIIEQTQKFYYSSSFSGGYFPDPSKDKISKYFYDDLGNLIFEEFYQRNGKFISRYIYHYDENNLLRSSYFKDSKHITFYSYEFF